MKILISNDDGIYSPGIVALANVASSFGDVRERRIRCGPIVDESHHNVDAAGNSRRPHGTTTQVGCATTQESQETKALAATDCNA